MTSLLQATYYCHGLHPSATGITLYDRELKQFRKNGTFNTSQKNRHILENIRKYYTRLSLLERRGFNFTYHPNDNDEHGTSIYLHAGCHSLMLGGYFGNEPVLSIYINKYATLRTLYVLAHYVFPATRHLFFVYEQCDPENLRISMPLHYNKITLVQFNWLKWKCSDSSADLSTASERLIAGRTGYKHFYDTLKQVSSGDLDIDEINPKYGMSLRHCMDSPRSHYYELTMSTPLYLCASDMGENYDFVIEDLAKLYSNYLPYITEDGRQLNIPTHYPNPRAVNAAYGPHSTIGITYYLSVSDMNDIKRRMQETALIRQQHSSTLSRAQPSRRPIDYVYHHDDDDDKLYASGMSTRDRIVAEMMKCAYPNGHVRNQPQQPRQQPRQQHQSTRRACSDDEYDDIF